MKSSVHKRLYLTVEQVVKCSLYRSASSSSRAELRTLCKHCTARPVREPPKFEVLAASGPCRPSIWPMTSSTSSTCQHDTKHREMALTVSNPFFQHPGSFAFDQTLIVPKPLHQTPHARQKYSTHSRGFSVPMKPLFVVGTFGSTSVFAALTGR